MTEFEKKLADLINHHSLENGSNTPDYLLAEFLVGCLNAYNEAVNSRQKWYGDPNLGPGQDPQPT